MQNLSNSALDGHLALVLILFQGHDMPLSLAEMTERLGLRKSALLRVLAVAARRGDVVPLTAFGWRRGSRGRKAVPPALGAGVFSGLAAVPRQNQE